MSDPIKTRAGLGGPVIKEAIAGNPGTRWYVMRRDHGVWTEVKSFPTEKEAVDHVAELRAASEVELMVVNKA